MKALLSMICRNSQKIKAEKEKASRRPSIFSNERTKRWSIIVTVDKKKYLVNKQLRGTGTEGVNNYEV